MSAQQLAPGQTFISFHCYILQTVRLSYFKSTIYKYLKGHVVSLNKKAC